MQAGGSRWFRAAPAPWGRVAAGHLPGALLAGAVLLAAFFLPLDRFAVRTCVFLRLTGYPCPSCGWTRGLVGMAAGEWGAVLCACPLAAVLYGVAAAVFAWNAAGLLLGVRLERGPWLRLGGQRGWWLLGGAVAAVLANWAYRLAMGLK